MRRYAMNVFQRESLDLTLDQWAVINILTEHNGKLNHSELSNIMMKDRPTLTRIIDILCKKGLTERKASESDRRVLNVILTKQGEGKVKEGYPIVAQVRSDLEAGLEKQDYEDLRRILAKINQNAEKR